MSILKHIVLGAAIMAAPFACADVPDAARAAQIVVLGEFHDNPDHHKVQAQWVAALSPKAIVFEMLTPHEAQAIMGLPRTRAALRPALDAAHWSNIADYIDIMMASNAALIGAAQPPETVRAAFSNGAAAVFGTDAGAYGLTDDLLPAELEMRKQMQFASHCKAMPIEMMAGMVEAQRFRDAAFAQIVLDALNTFGAPVGLVTGNGHARRDWGVPALLAIAAPDVMVFALGQSEAGQPLSGGFDLVRDAPAPKRGDPCAAFQ